MDKICSSCKNPYPATLDYFYADGRGGLAGICKDCQKTRSRKNYAANRRERLEKQRIYDEEHRAEKAAWRERNRERSRNYHRNYYRKYRRKAPAKQE